MPRITVYYEYDYMQDRQAPIWYVLSFARNEMDWSKKTLYIPVLAPFQKQESEDFESGTIGMTIEISDLIIHQDKPGFFGINLPMVKQRAENLGCEVMDIQQFILQVLDLEEVLQMSLFRK